jgi:hypothetical protein
MLRPPLCAEASLDQFQKIPRAPQYSDRSLLSPYRQRKYSLYADSMAAVFDSHAAVPLPENYLK